MKSLYDPVVVAIIMTPGKAMQISVALSDINLPVHQLPSGEYFIPRQAVVGINNQIIVTGDTSVLNYRALMERVMKC